MVTVFGRKEPDPPTTVPPTTPAPAPGGKFLPGADVVVTTTTGDRQPLVTVGKVRREETPGMYRVEVIHGIVLLLTEAQLAPQTPDKP